MAFEFYHREQEYRITDVTILGDGRFRYVVQGPNGSCEVESSLDLSTCESGCLDPETRAQACRVFSEEIIKSFKQ